MSFYLYVDHKDIANRHRVILRIHVNRYLGEMGIPDNRTRGYTYHHRADKQHKEYPRYHFTPSHPTYPPKPTHMRARSRDKSSGSRTLIPNLRLPTACSLVSLRETHDQFLPCNCTSLFLILRFRTRAQYDQKTKKGGVCGRYHQRTAGSSPFYL